MIAKKMLGYVQGSSLIRAMFEDSKQMAAVYGAENVYDFSLGNPCFAPPAAVNESIKRILDTEDPIKVHGYMSNGGHEEVRGKIAESIGKRFGFSVDVKNIIMTVGAAGGMNVTFKTLIDPGDEIVTFKPYFGEYNSYAANVEANLVAVASRESDFQPDMEEFEKAITAKTKVVIINSPNNPTGVVYSEETIKTIADILEKKEKEFGTSIYIFADEPYRELAYDGVEVPYIPNYYKNTIVGYSYSKSLSLAGERIGYLVIPDAADDAENVISAATVATRILGFVNAPSILQLAIGECIDVEMDISCYDKNRKALYDGLTDIGYECVKPDGAFYLFMKSPIDDDIEFSKIAKEFRLVIVPGTAFACPGYIRLAYCTSYETIVNALLQFKLLWEKING